MKAKIKKKDKVMIIAGKDKGKTGEVNRVLLTKNKVVIAGLNVVKKATKPSKKNTAGGIIEISKPVDISNIALVCPACGKPTRVGILVTKAGQKERICKACQKAIKE